MDRPACCFSETATTMAGKRGAEVPSQNPPTLSCQAPARALSTLTVSWLTRTPTPIVVRRTWMAMQGNGFALEEEVSPRTRCGACPCAGCAVRACARAHVRMLCGRSCSRMHWTRTGLVLVCGGCLLAFACSCPGRHLHFVPQCDCR